VATDKSGCGLFRSHAREFDARFESRPPGRHGIGLRGGRRPIPTGSGFFNFIYDQTDGTTVKAWDIEDFNLKVGLLNNVELQRINDDYLNVHTEDNSGKATTQSGFRDFTTQLKIILWGDDSGKTASASVDHQLLGGLGAFLEFAGNFAAERHVGWTGTVDTGLEHLITQNIRADLDRHLGVTHAAPDFNLFAGSTMRF
jgi:hypothetical protein